MRIFLALLFIHAAVLCQGQPASIWTKHTLAFRHDTATALVDMSGATVPVSGSVATDLIPFAAGFTFRNGLKSFTSFSISKWGFVKLGAVPNSIGAPSQDSVIAPFFAYSVWNIKYKYIGMAPYRVLVVDWTGYFSPNSKSVSFQLLLHETNGKIQMIYSGVNAYSTSSNAYNILVRQSMFDLHHMASVDVPATNTSAFPVYKAFDASWGYLYAYIDNRETIHPLARYTFQPDTVRLATPVITFENVMPGCMDVKPVYDSTEASVFFLEKQHPVNGFLRLGMIVAGKSYYDATLNTNTTYTYRGWTTNGFTVSDTVVQSKLMPLPLMNGVYTVPGDYPNITALLRDAQCKQFGANVVIELQSSYSYALEPAPVRIGGQLRNPFMHELVIRPAAGAFVILTAPSTINAPMFLIDSMTHVVFDGRQGGTGSTPSMVIRQPNIYLPAIAFVNAADSGEVRYCVVESNGQQAVISLTGRDKFNSHTLYGVDGVRIHHNKFGPSTGTAYTFIFVEGNFGKGMRNIIENNEFFRFEREAIIFRHTAICEIRNNRFYQPDNIWLSGGVGILLDNSTSSLVEDNRFGGASASWGTDTWRTSGEYKFIKSTSGGVFRNNEFGNIYNEGYTTTMIYATGSVTISGNRFGTADSTASIVSSQHLWSVYLYGAANNIIENNFFSGMKAGQDLIFVAADNLTSYGTTTITGNDFGGSDRYTQNTAYLRVDLVTAYASELVIANNKIRGATALHGGAYGISVGHNFGTPAVCNVDIRNNEIHHLQGKLSMYGIAAASTVTKTNRIANNTIYALRGVGPSRSPGAYQPALTCGIDFGFSGHLLLDDSLTLEVSGNNVHSLDYLTPERAYIYNMVGIITNAPYKVRVVNNVVRLGLNSKGHVIDTLETGITGIATGAMVTEIEHNSIYIGGIGGTGISMTADINQGTKTAFVSNNIIQIDRTKNPTFPSGRFITSPAFRPVDIIASNNNIWYSATNTSVQTELDNWRNTCKCDSATFVVNPLFINPVGDSSNVNLHLQAGTPADGAGTPSYAPVTHDRDSLQRDQYSPVDIGAYAATPCISAVPFVSMNRSNTVYKCPSSSLQLVASVSGSFISMNWQKNLQNIPGATTSALTITQTGSYRLVVKYACGVTAGQSVNVYDSVQTQQPYVNIISETSGTVCNGGELALRVYNYGLTSPLFKWLRNGVADLQQTGVTAHFTNVRLNDFFEVEVTNQWTCPSVIKDSFRVLNVSPAVVPAVTLAASDSIICPNKSINLTATPTHPGWQPSYTWKINGRTIANTNNPALTIGGLKNNDSVTVSLTSNATCAVPATVQSNVIRITIKTPPVAAAGADTLVCSNGNAVQIGGAAQDAYSYAWSPATGLSSTSVAQPLAKPSSSTEYLLRVTDPSGCNDYDSVFVAVVPMGVPVVTASGNVLSSSVPYGNQWYLNGTPINGATGQHHTAVTPGNYMVRITVAGCTAESAAFNYVVTGIAAPQDGDSVIVYPNPVQETLFLKNPSGRRLQVQLVDIHGRKVHQGMLIHTEGTIDMKGLSRGIYQLFITDGDKTSGRVIIRR